MEDTDKLLAVVQRLSPSQVKQVVRFAEFILQDEAPYDMTDYGDVRQRFAEFKAFCEAGDVDLSTIDEWARQTNGRPGSNNTSPGGR